MTGLSFYYVAFEELSSCRGVGFGMGPIPWTALHTYCEVHGLENEDREDFIHLIWAIDVAYLEHVSSKDK